MKKICMLVVTLALLLGVTACQPANGGTDAPFAAVVINGQTIAIDAEAAPILSALGKELEYAESPSCAFEGMDKIYVYAGFRLQTYTKSGKDYVRSVELTDDSVSTVEGIRIGDSVEQVKTAYGTPGEESATALKYADAKNGITLQILVRDGRVTNIQYIKNV